MERICVYCGSSPGSEPEYARTADRLGKALAQSGIGLVYGGGNIGMMGILANSVVKHNGEVTGVITHHLFEMEVAFKEQIDLRVVETMHERKAMMADLADGFIALPGGFGTMDEMFEVLTWAQLNLHQKPCGFLNVNGYYDKLIEFVHQMMDKQFVASECENLIHIADSPSELIKAFRGHQPLNNDKGAWAKALAAKRCDSVRAS